MTPLQEDARADAVDSLVRDIQNTQCMLNVEYSGTSCPHVTLQFTDSKDDVGLGLVKEGTVMVDVRKEKHLQKMVSKNCSFTQLHVPTKLCVTGECHCC